MLWAGQTISQLGDYVAYFTIPAFVRYVITSQPSDFGLVYAAESFPTFWLAYSPVYSSIGCDCAR